MEGVKITGNTVSGTLKYVTGYTEFNQSEVEEQSGNYLALDFADSFTDGNVTSIQVDHTGGNAKTTTLTQEDSFYVLRVADPNDTITATPTGSGALQPRTLKLAVTLEPNSNLVSMMSETKTYTKEDIESMTVKEIKEIADERGYTISQVLKADIIEEFLSQQNAG